MTTRPTTTDTFGRQLKKEPAGANSTQGNIGSAVPYLHPAVGPPARHLPAGWMAGLTATQVHSVCIVELTGRPRLAKTPIDRRGYTRLYLGRHHPYADRAGYARLHRWLVERSLGIKLPPYRHVHHRPGASKDTTDLSDLEILEATEHGMYHYGRNFQRVDGELVMVDRCEYTDEELLALSMQSMQSIQSALPG